MEVFEKRSDRRSNTISMLPVGYRFSPTDEEIITYYLRSRILNQPLPPDKVKEIELYDHTPEQLEEYFGARREAEMYFFTKRKLNCVTATRPNRTIAKEGYWRASSKTSIKDDSGKVIGYKMLLNFYVKTETIADTMTSWLMYEYTTPSGSKKMDELVLCKVYDKRNDQKQKINEQLEKPLHSVEQAPYQVGHVVLQNHNMEPQTPIYQVSNDGLQEAFANIEMFTWKELYEMAGMDFTGKPNVWDNQVDGVVLQNQNVEPKAPVYQFVDAGIHDQNLKPQAPAYQASDAEIHNRTSSDYQPPMAEAPSYQFNSIECDIPNLNMDSETMQLLRSMLQDSDDHNSDTNVSYENMAVMDFTWDSSNVCDGQHPVLQADEQHYSAQQAVAPANQYNTKEDEDARQFAQYLEEMLQEPDFLELQEPALAQNMVLRG